MGITMRVNLYGIYKLIGYVEVDESNLEHCPIYIEYHGRIFIKDTNPSPSNFNTAEGYYLIPEVTKIRKGKIYEK